MLLRLDPVCAGRCSLSAGNNRPYSLFRTPTAMASQDFTKLLEGMKEADLKLFAACYLYANIENSSVRMSAWNPASRLP